MNNDEDAFDDIDVKELTSSHLDDFILDLHGRTICLFPGNKADPGKDVPTFWDCLPRLLDDCTVLIFCELHLTRDATLAYLEAQKGKERHGITIQEVIPIPTDCHKHQDGFFPGYAKSSPDWVPASARPLPDRFWHHAALLGIPTHDQELRLITLLYLGIGEQAVWLYFLNPRAVRVNQIIIDPRGDYPERGGLGQPEPPADNSPQKPC